MSNEIVKLDEMARDFQIQKLTEQGHFSMMVQAAEAMSGLEKHITPAIVDVVMKMQGSQLGFVTDKDSSGGYPPEVVKKCFIEATIRGARPIGNEFNIIAGKCYLTKNAVKRLVREFPGISHLDIILESPVEENKQTLVPFKARWKINGEEYALDDGRVPVRVNAGMIVDAILGKAEKKVYDRIYEKLSGLNIPNVDDDIITAEYSKPVTKLEAGKHKIKDEPVVKSLEDMKKDLSDILTQAGISKKEQSAWVKDRMDRNDIKELDCQSIGVLFSEVGNE